MDDLSGLSCQAGGWFAPPGASLLPTAWQWGGSASGLCLGRSLSLPPQVKTMGRDPGRQQDRSSPQPTGKGREAALGCRTTHFFRGENRCAASTQPPKASPLSGLGVGGKRQPRRPPSSPSPLQDGVLQNRRLWLLIKALCRFRSSSRYRVLQRRLERDAMWPPLHGRDLADGGSSQAYLNPAFEPEEPAGRPGSRAGTASCAGAQPEGTSLPAAPAESRKDGQEPQETRCLHRCSEGTFPRLAAP